jgi:hypothetical protein
LSSFIRNWQPWIVGNSALFSQKWFSAPPESAITLISFRRLSTLKLIQPVSCTGIWIYASCGSDGYKGRRCLTTWNNGMGSIHWIFQQIGTIFQFTTFQHMVHVFIANFIGTEYLKGRSIGRF